MKEAFVRMTCAIGRLHRSAVVLLSAGLLVPAAVFAQQPWTVTLTPTMNPLPIGFCAAIQLTVFDPATKDVPRNALGNRVTIADFDIAVTAPDGASATAQQIDASHVSACGCQRGAVGMVATVTATYPAQSLATAARVPGAAVQQTATFVLSAAHGTVNPPACLTAGAKTGSSASALPASSAVGAQPPRTTAALSANPPPVTVAAPARSDPAASSTAIALPPAATPVEVAPPPARAAVALATTVAPPPSPPPAAVAPPPARAATAQPPAVALPPTAPPGTRATPPAAAPPGGPAAAAGGNTPISEAPAGRVLYVPAPMTVTLALGATGSWYQPGPATVNLALSADGSWYAPGPLTVTLGLSATGNWIGLKTVPAGVVDPSPPVR